VEYINLLPLPEIKARYLDCPVRSSSLYRLSYPSFQKETIKRERNMDKARKERRNKKAIKNEKTFVLAYSTHLIHTSRINSAKPATSFHRQGRRVTLS
jgi:hypothetical protein